MKKVNKITLVLLNILIFCVVFAPGMLAESKSETQQKMISILYNGAGGKVSCDFDGYVNTSGRHEGIDFCASNGSGTAIYSLIDGTVTRCTNSSSLSTCAIYDETNNKTVVYLHGHFSVSTGQTITRGQYLGYEYNHGASSAHTHIEVRDGKRTAAAVSVNDSTLDNANPYPYWQTVLGEVVSCSCSESYAGEYICTTTSSNLIIRSTHGTSGNLGTIPPGATVTVTKANGEWAHVEYNGVSGYASMAYLQKKEPNLIPTYALDVLEGGLGTIYVKGWAFDDNAPTEPVDIHIYVGGVASPNLPCYIIQANQERTDIGTAYPGRGNYHGFMETIPVDQYGDVTVTLYAINIGGDNHPMIASQTVHITKPPALSNDFPDDFYARIANNATKTLLTNDEKGDGMGSYEVVFSAAQNTEAQIWHFTKNSNGSYRIVPLCDENILLHAHAASNTPGTHIITTPVIPDATSQQWWIYKEDGLYYLRPGCADTCFLDLPNASSANGVRAEINTYNTEGGEGLLIETVRRSTIQYNANGGADAPDTQYKMQGMEMTLSAKVPTRAGYTFLGWAESSSAVSAAYQPGNSFTKDKDVTLYAVWKQNAVQPTNNPKLTLTSVQTAVQPGKTFTVEMGVDNNPGVAAMTILVDYDESIMTLTGITSSSSMQVVTTEDAPNKAVLLNMTGDITDAQKSLAVLTFEVDKDAPLGQTNISVSCSDSSNYNAELLTWQDSVPLQLMISRGLLGDVNSDGKLSTQDVILLSRYVLSADSVKIDTTVADMNGDSRINSQDIVLLCQAVLKVS